jgi:glycosyltransferase involved in cell wall biosynthesis
MGGIIQQSRINIAAESLSIVLITLNEEINLCGLLPEIPKGAEIIIIDSGSQDKTKELAMAHGAYFEFRAFDDYASQKTYAVSKATRPWTLVLDADERPDQRLWSEILFAVRRNETKSYRMCRRLIFCGRKMRHGRTRDWVERLFPTGVVYYANEIHETACFSRPVAKAKLAGILWHQSYRDLTDYFAKFNRYTTLVAKARVSKNKGLPSKVVLAARLPLDFIARYVFRAGFLDGWPGFLWAVLGSFYGFIKYVKALEAKSRAQI